jgi:hypothetical protein
MSWIVAAIATWLLPGVLIVLLTLAVGARKWCSDLVIALRRRQAQVRPTSGDSGAGEPTST